MFEMDFSNGVIIGMIAAMGCCCCCATGCFIGCLFMFCDSYNLKRRKIVDEIKKQEDFIPEWKRQYTLQLQGYETPATEGYASSTSKGTKRLDVES